MNSVDLVLQLIKAFDASDVQYMLVGSLSSNYYGRPRSTKDADFLVQINNAQLNAVMKMMGSDFKIDSQMSFESVTMTTRYMIDHPTTAFKIELFLLSEDPHDHLRFARRKDVDFEGMRATLPTAEDVIITKLRWSKNGRRAKDVDDIVKILTVRSAELDLVYIRQWADQHATRDLFEKLLTAVQTQA